MQQVQTHAAQLWKLNSFYMLDLVGSLDHMQTLFEATTEHLKIHSPTNSNYQLPAWARLCLYHIPIKVVGLITAMYGAFIPTMTGMIYFLLGSILIGFTSTCLRQIHANEEESKPIHLKGWWWWLRAITALDMTIVLITLSTNTFNYHYKTASNSDGCILANASPFYKAENIEEVPYGLICIFLLCQIHDLFVNQSSAFSYTAYYMQHVSPFKAVLPALLPVALLSPLWDVRYEGTWVQLYATIKLIRRTKSTLHCFIFKPHWLFVSDQ